MPQQAREQNTTQQSESGKSSSKEDLKRQVEEGVWKLLQADLRMDRERRGQKRRS